MSKREEDQDNMDQGENEDHCYTENVFQRVTEFAQHADAIANEIDDLIQRILDNSFLLPIFAVGCEAIDQMKQSFITQMSE